MIKLVKSTFYKEKETKKALASFIIKTDILSMGEQCRLFEQSFAKKQGRKYAVLVSSGSMANLILIQAFMNIGIFKVGDKIGVSALTWATNIMPLMQLGLVPVMLDVNLRTFNVPPTELEKFGDKIKGFFITNVLGLCDDLPQIRKICMEKGIILFEDNCESLGSQIADTLFGNFGVASTFSFFVGHHLSTIEGGMICTDDEDLHDMIIMVRAHGWDRNLPLHKQKKIRDAAQCDDFYSKYTFHDLAYNGRPTEITGFLGNTQLPHLDVIIKNRQSNFKRFVAAVNENDDFIPIDFKHIDVVSNMCMPVVCVSLEKAKKYKNRFETVVEIRPIIAGNMIKQPFYKKYISKITDHTNTDQIHRNGFYFSNNPELTKTEVDLIVSLLKK